MSKTCIYTDLNFNDVLFDENIINLSFLASYHCYLIFKRNPADDLFLFTHAQKVAQANEVYHYW